RPGVQVERIQHDAKDVVLLLAISVVADAHWLRAVVAVQVLERVLGQVSPAVDAVNDLHVPAVALDQISEEREVVAGLPVEAECEQTPESERGIPDPAVPVVPVALTARRFGQ